MSPRTLYDKLWDEHVVHTEEDGTAVLYIDRHLVHEVTSPQAFEGLRLAGRKVWRVSSVVATADHNTPTTGWAQGYDGIADPISKLQVTTLDANIRAFGAAAYFPFLDKRQGIASGSFPAPDHEYPSHLELRLTATDAVGRVLPAVIATAAVPVAPCTSLTRNPTW